MKTSNCFIKTNCDNHSLEDTLLLQIKSAMESLRDELKDFKTNPLKQAVEYLSSEHGLSCHLLCRLRQWHEKDALPAQRALISALIDLVEIALDGRIADPVRHRKAVELLLSGEISIAEVSTYFGIYAAKDLHAVDPRHLVQWRGSSSSHALIAPSIWKTGDTHPSNQAIQTIRANRENLSDEQEQPLFDIAPGEAQAPAASPDFPVFSRSQQLAFEGLQTMLQLFRSTQRSLAGIQPRFHPLLAGPSGAGKTFLVGELARRNRLPLHALNVGSWVVSGGHRPTTPQLLAEFIERNEAGVIFIDEVDKIGGTTDWMRYVQQEVFALLDGRFGDFPDWSAALNEKLRGGFFIVGAGTWQDLQPPALRHGAYADPPFGPLVSPGPKRRASLAGQSSIPEELLLRFNCAVLHLEPMEREEIEQRVREVCAAGGFETLTARQINELVEEVMGSRVPHRAMESLVTRILTHNAKSGSR